MLVRFITLLYCLWAATAAAQDVVIDPQYDRAGTFHVGLAPVQVGDLWGIVNRSGQMQIPPQFRAVLPGTEGLRAVQFDEDFTRWTYIDARGAAPHFDQYWTAARPYRGGWAAVRDFNDEWQFINTKGFPISSTKFAEVADWNPPYATVFQDGRWQVVHIGTKGYVNTVDDYSGNLDGNAQGVRYLIDGLFVITTTQGQTLMRVAEGQQRPEPFVSDLIADDNTGETIFFNAIGRPSEGFVPVQSLSGGWAYYHVQTAKIVWADRFDQVRRMSEGFAAVERKGKWGYIDRRGQFVVKPTYDRAFDFHEGYAVIRRGDQRGFLYNDPEQGIVEFIQPQFDDVFRFQEGLAPIMLDGRWGFVSDGRPAPAPGLRQSAVETLEPG